MTKVKFNELAKNAGKKLGPLARIALAIMFLIAPGSALISILKAFLESAEDLSDNEIKEIREAIKNA
jgi:hypothetical protein